jgi:hypothetical protein
MVRRHACRVHVKPGGQRRSPQPSRVSATTPQNWGINCAQIAIIPTNSTIDVSEAASSTNVLNMACSCERIENIVPFLFSESSGGGEPGRKEISLVNSTVIATAQPPSLIHISQYYQHLTDQLEPARTMHVDEARPNRLGGYRYHSAGAGRLEDPMRIALLAVMAIGTFAAIDIAPAEARDYPFCMRTRYDGDECRYPTYQSCQWAASGTGQTCFQNPALAYRPQPYFDEPAPRRRTRQPQGYY